MDMKKRTKAGTSKQSAEIRRKLFSEAFVRNEENITQSAIDAGFSEKTAYAAGARLLKDVRVLTEINRIRAQIVANAELSTDRVVKEISKIAFSDPRRLIGSDGKFKKLGNFDDDLAASIASVKVLADGAIEYKFWDKNSALEKACKILGAFKKDNEQQSVIAVDATEAANRIAQLMRSAKAKKDES